VPRSSQGAGDRSKRPLAPLIHGRVRLLVLSYLKSADRPVPFTELRDRLGLTDGSLSVQLQKLEAAQVVRLDRRFVGKRPQTLVALTDSGRQAYAEYIEDLRRIVPGLS
jgi:DNA-binding MarR family transcriptional regulator